MAITVRDLAHRTREVLWEVEHERRKILVTSNGRLVAALVPIDEEELLDLAFGALVPSDTDVAREIMEGRTESLADIASELGL